MKEEKGQKGTVRERKRLRERETHCERFRASVCLPPHEFNCVALFL